MPRVLVTLSLKLWGSSEEETRLESRLDVRSSELDAVFMVASEVAILVEILPLKSDMLLTAEVEKWSSVDDILGGRLVTDAVRLSKELE